MIATVAAVVVVGWLAVFQANGSRALAPAPLTLVYPMATMTWRLERVAIRHSEELVVTFVAALYGILFLSHLVGGARRIPRLSVALFAALTLGNLLFWVWAWRDGVEWQGASYTVSVGFLNVVLVVLAAFVLIRGHRLESFWTNYCFHTLMVLWICWVSCPWLGEMP